MVAVRTAAELVALNKQGEKLLHHLQYIPRYVSEKILSFRMDFVSTNQYHPPTAFSRAHARTDTIDRMMMK